MRWLLALVVLLASSTPAVAVIITVCPVLADCGPGYPPAPEYNVPPSHRSLPGRVTTCWHKHPGPTTARADDIFLQEVDAVGCEALGYYYPEHFLNPPYPSCPACAGLYDAVFNAPGTLPGTFIEWSVPPLYANTTFVPASPPACTHTFAISNSFIAPWSREIKIQSPMGALLPGNLALAVEPNSTWRPALSLPYPTTSPTVYIANLLVPRSGGPWQITLTLPSAFAGCQISSAEWPDPSLLPGQFVASRPKTSQDVTKLLSTLDMRLAALAYMESQMTQFPVNSPIWKIQNRTRHALLATIARTQTVIMDPIDMNYLVNPPAVGVISLGPNLTATPSLGITSAMITTINTWHKKLMAHAASLHRATQWIDKMNGALLAGNHARALILAAGADAQFENAYTLAKAEVALRKTMSAQWTTTYPAPAHCTTAEDGAEHVEVLVDLGFALDAALPVAYVTPEACVPAGAWPTALVNPAMRADLLAAYLGLHTMSVKANLCASAGVC